MLDFKSMYRLNPVFKGFILSCFGWVACVGQDCPQVHTKVHTSLVKYFWGQLKDTLDRKGLNLAKPHKYTNFLLALICHQSCCCIASSQQLSSPFCLLQLPSLMATCQVFDLRVPATTTKPSPFVCRQSCCSVASHLQLSSPFVCHYHLFLSATIALSHGWVSSSSIQWSPLLYFRWVSMGY